MDSISAAIELTAPGATASVSHAEFTGCVDRCVSALVSAPQSMANRLSADETAQLRTWLGEGLHALDDGTPIDFALFDSTILSVEERLPVAGGSARTQLLNAARRLAESLYAPASRYAKTT